MIREVSQNSSTTSRANCSYYSPTQVSGIEFNCRSTAIDKPVNGQPQALSTNLPCPCYRKRKPTSPRASEHGILLQSISSPRRTLLEVASYHLDERKPNIMALSRERDAEGASKRRPNASVLHISEVLISNPPSIASVPERQLAFGDIQYLIMNLSRRAPFAKSSSGSDAHRQNG